MPCALPCRNCDRKGLPILFTRYAAAYSAQEKSMSVLGRMQPVAPFEAQPEGVALQAAVYNVRMLRFGYLYVRYVSPLYPMPIWRGYAVHPHGYLAQFDISQPEEAQSKPACEMEVRGANMSMVWIEEAKLVTEFHHMFHPDPIDIVYLKKEIEPNRDKYMQKLDVAALAGGATGLKHTCNPDQLNTRVVEFAALGNEGLRDAMEGQFFGLMGNNGEERAWGTYSEQREGSHVDAVVEERHDANGNVEPIIPDRAAGHPVKGPYTAIVHGPSYVEAHGKRLKKITEFLTQHKGAVVACQDPIGMAQTLGMSHAMAAVPYELWRQSKADAAIQDFPQLTNSWLAEASSAIEKLLGAMKQGLTASQKAELERLREHREQIANGTIFVPGRQEAGANGKPIPVGSDEAKRRLLERLDARIAKQQAGVDTGTSFDPKDTIAEARKHFDQTKLDKFDTLHRGRLKDLDDQLSAMSKDTIAWLDAGPMLKTLERYNGQPADQRGDGERFAIQMSVALLALDTSSVGKLYLGTKNPFTFSRDNLVARMVSCNDPAVSQEIKAHCERLDVSAITNAYAQAQRDTNEARLKELDAVTKMVSGWSKVVKSTEKMNKLYDKPPEKTSDKLKAVNDVQSTIKAAAGAGWSTVLFAAASLFAARAGGTEKEKTLLGARALALSYAMGTEAQALLRVEREALAKKMAAANPRLNKVGVGGPREWQAEAGQLQSKLDDTVKANGTKSVVGKMRVAGLVLIAEAFGTLVSGTARAGIKQDARTALETMGQYLSLMGSFRDLRTNLCEDMVFKTVITKIDGRTLEVAAIAKGTKLDQVAIERLLKLRSAAGRFAIAGAGVTVGLDVFDSWRAVKDERRALTLAYWTRAIGGGFTVTGVVISMRTIYLATLVGRLNLVGIVLTVVSTIAIEMLKPKLWEDWLRAQPFRMEKDNTDGGLWAGLAKPTPHKSEAQMLSKLDDAVKGAEGG